MQTLKYRPDIDGLRAIAVLSVIFYHFGFNSLFGSGFTGVDIFFVLSGYLITSIIYPQILENKFSFLDFYERRIRRILPVFLFVLFTTVLFAWYFTLLPETLNDLLNSAFSTLVMGSNFFFWQDNDYFSAPSNTKALLHTWSLALEEQFYIVFPILLLYLAKKQFLIKALFLLCLISLTLCMLLSFIDQNTAFYLLPFRAWELLFGSLLAIFTINKTSFIKTDFSCNLLGIIGIAMLLFSVTYLKTIHSVFPGFIAIFPCLATVLCIESGKSEKSITRKLLSFPLFVFIGKISYSLYLWHWPVSVFAREIVYTKTMNLPLDATLFSIFLTFILSILSYLFIEQPIRKKKLFHQRKTLFIAMFLCSVFIGLFAFAAKEYFPESSFTKYSRSYALYQKNAAYSQNPDPHIPRLFHFGNQKKEITHFVMGDSHASVLFFLLDKLGKEHDVHGVIYNSPPTLINATIKNNPSPKFKENDKQVREFIIKQPIKSILFSARWAYRIYGFNFPTEGYYLPQATLNYTDEKNNLITDSPLAARLALQETLDLFKPQKLNVFFNLPIPEFPSTVPLMAAKAIRKTKGIENQEFREMLTIPFDHKKDFEKVRENFEKLENQDIKFIDLASKICKNDTCFGLVQENIPLHYDNNHLTRKALMTFEEDFLPFILSGKE